MWIGSQAEERPGQHLPPLPFQNRALHQSVWFSISNDGADNFARNKVKGGEVNRAGRSSRLGGGRPVLPDHRQAQQPDADPDQLAEAAQEGKRDPGHIGVAEGLE